MHDDKTIRKFDHLLNHLRDKLGFPREEESAQELENPAKEAIELLEDARFRALIKRLREENIKAMRFATNEEDRRKAQVAFDYGERIYETLLKLIETRGHLLAEEIAEEELKPMYQQPEETEL